MSSNNQIIIRKEKRKWRTQERYKFIIYLNPCVDNEFEYNKEDIIGASWVLENAVQLANNYMKNCEFPIEYGISLEI